MRSPVTPPDPPTHPQKNGPQEGTIQFIKGAGNLRLTLGTHTFWGAWNPPPLGWGGALTQQWPAMGANGGAAGQAANILTTNTGCPLAQIHPMTMGSG